MIFSYNMIEIEILEKFKGCYHNWWKVLAIYSIAGTDVKEILWVIPKVFTDYRIIFANEMKTYFNLPKLEICFTRIKSRSYYLIKSFDPHERPEITLNIYTRDLNNDTEILYEKIQLIYAYRRLMCMCSNGDHNIIVRQIRGKINLYSIDTFSEKRGTTIDDKVFHKWFDLLDRMKKRHKFFNPSEKFDENFIPPSRSTLTLATEKLTGIRKPKSLDNEEYEKFHNEIEPLIQNLSKIVNSINKDYVWYISDIYNYLLTNQTP